MASVILLGAGLTGLSAAFHLRRGGVDCRVLEKLAVPGGHAVTIEEDGWRFDRTGHLLHLRDPEMKKLALSWIEGEVLEIERRSRIFSHGVYTRYPFQANTYGLPAGVAHECLMGFLQAHFAKDAPEPTNFEEFCRIRFGEGISRHFMIPYNTRLWGVPPSAISAAWCARFVPIPKLEDVVAGAVGLNDRELGYNTRFVYPKLGIGELARGLARAAGPLELGRAPDAVDWRKRVVHAGGEAIEYCVLVSSVPLPVLVRLLVDPPAEVAAAAARLKCTHLWYLDVALDEPCAKDLHWVYVPEQRFPFYRVGCYSNFSSAMAPRGKAGLYLELADRSEPDLTTLLPEVAKGLCEMQLVSSPAAIRFVRARRIDHAYVVFDEQYFAAVETIRAFLDAESILSTGRYGGWNYSSMEDALTFGRDAAAEASRRL